MKRKATQNAENGVVWGS